MTKRKPLLSFLTNEYGESDPVLFIGCDGYPADEPLELLYKKINAAFNARMDEEVRKAVEEFRERVLHVVEGHICGPGCGVRGFGDSCSFDFPKAIRALPTEPERGGER